MTNIILNNKAKQATKAINKATELVKRRDNTSTDKLHMKRKLDVENMKGDMVSDILDSRKIY